MLLLRILGLLIAAVVMVGFGLCGALGVVLGYQASTQGQGIEPSLFLGIAGLVVFAAFAWFIGSQLRKMMASSRK